MPSTPMKKNVTRKSTRQQPQQRQKQQRRSLSPAGRRSERASVSTNRVGNKRAQTKGGSIASSYVTAMVPNSAYTDQNNRFDGGGKKNGKSTGGSQASDLVMSYVNDLHKGGGKNNNTINTTNANRQQQQRIQSPEARPLLTPQQEAASVNAANTNAAKTKTKTNNAKTGQGESESIAASIKGTLGLSGNQNKKANSNGTANTTAEKQHQQDSGIWKTAKQAVGLNANNGTSNGSKNTNNKAIGLKTPQNTNGSKSGNTKANANKANTSGNEKKDGGGGRANKKQTKKVAKRGGSGSGCDSSTDPSANLSDLFVNNRITSGSSLPASVPESRQSPDFIHTHNGVLSSQPATLSTRGDVVQFPENSPAAGQPFSMMGSPVHQTPSAGFDSLPNGHNYVYHL